MGHYGNNQKMKPKAFGNNAGMIRRICKYAAVLAVLIVIAGSQAACDLNPDSSPSSSAPLQTGQAGDRIPAFVERVVDGDTLEVIINGRQETLRLIGLNTPETWKSPQGAEPWGEEASAYTREQLTGQDVYLEYDVEKRDQYGRLLAYVWLNGQLFNEELVRSGWADARTYSPNVKYQDRLDQAEKEARAQHLGQWK